MIGCGAGSSCEKVLSSRWANVLGFMPLSGLALGIYVAVLVCLLMLRQTKDVESVRLLWMVLTLLAGAITGSAVWFILLQKYVVQAFCPYCMSVHGTGLLVSGMIIYRSFRELKGTRRLLPCAATGLVLAAALAVLQWTTTPKSIYDKGAAQEDLPVMDLSQTPVIGSPQARHVVQLLFDYQCTHCRKVHIMARELAAQQPQEWAFALCFTPLSPACNPYIPHNANASFSGSCDLAKLALAVWKTNPGLFDAYDDWLFETDKGNLAMWRPRTVEQARQKALELIGEEALTAALQDGWIESRLMDFAHLFGRTTHAEKAGLPRLVYGNNWVIPEVLNVEALVEVMNINLI